MKKQIVWASPLHNATIPRDIAIAKHNAIYPCCYKKCFNMIELLITIAIIAILASIILPALHSARESAKTITCVSQERQLAIGFSLYADDNSGFYPYILPGIRGMKKVGGWIYVDDFPIYSRHEAADVTRGEIWPYCSSERVFSCPANMTVASCTYAATSDCSLASLEQVKHPSSTIFLTEESPMEDPSFFTNDGLFCLFVDGVRNIHRNRSVYGYFDGHIQNLKLPIADVWNAGDFLEPFGVQHQISP